MLAPRLRRALTFLFPRRPPAPKPVYPSRELPFLMFPVYRHGKMQPAGTPRPPANDPFSHCGPPFLTQNPWVWVTPQNPSRSEPGKKPEPELAAASAYEIGYEARCMAGLARAQAACKASLLDEPVVRIVLRGSLSGMEIWKLASGSAFKVASNGAILRRPNCRCEWRPARADPHQSLVYELRAHEERALRSKRAPL